MINVETNCHGLAKDSRRRGGFLVVRQRQVVLESVYHKATEMDLGQEGERAKNILYS